LLLLGLPQPQALKELSAGKPAQDAQFCFESLLAGHIDPIDIHRKEQPLLRTTASLYNN
jgi:hypothetical protein